MARKKSRFSLLPWIAVTVVSSGGLGGYLKPDTPVIGPLVNSVLGGKGAESIGEGDLSNAISLLSSAKDRGGQTPGQSMSAQSMSAQRPRDRLLIASFNIQVLGKSKMSKPGVVEVLAQTIRQFDLVAIQEVRAKEDDILPKLVAAVNADGSQYNFLIGPRIGRTVSTEQYAYVFDTTRVEIEQSSYGTIEDPSDLLHREPFVARFRARTQSPSYAFTFWLVNIHTDPDEVPQEVDALADIFQIMQSARPDEDDVILLGDLNASEKQLGRLGKIPGVVAVVNGTMTNTRRTKAYDNIILHAPSTSEFTGRWGVYDLESTFGLSREDALKVSDHLPVWAEFGVWEAASPTASNNRTLGRRR